MENNLILQLQIQQASQEIRSCEAYYKAYGLHLTEQDITDLVQLRQEVLQRTRRVELGGGILPKLIALFSSSPYVDNSNFPTVLGELQEAFYYFKNESRDLFSDDELLEFMEKVFNGRAEGSGELLSTIALEDLCRWARNPEVSPYQEEQQWF